MADNDIDLFANAICTVAVEWQKVVLEKLNNQCPPETITFLWSHTYSVLAHVAKRDRRLTRDELIAVKSETREQHVIRGIAGFFAHMDRDQIDLYKDNFNIMCVITGEIVAAVGLGEKPSDALRQCVSAFRITKSIFEMPTVGGVLVFAHIGIFQECLQLKL